MPLTFCDRGECLALVQGLIDACFIHPSRRWKKLEASGHQGISCVFLGLCFQLIVLATPGARNQLGFGCSLLKSRWSRSKGRWKKKGALFRKLATWGGGELVSPKPSPNGQIDQKLTFVTHFLTRLYLHMKQYSLCWREMIIRTDGTILR